MIHAGLPYRNPEKSIKSKSELGFESKSELELGILGDKTSFKDDPNYKKPIIEWELDTEYAHGAYMAQLFVTDKSEDEDIKIEFVFLWNYHRSIPKKLDNFFLEITLDKGPTTIIQGKPDNKSALGGLMSLRFTWCSIDWSNEMREALDFRLKTVLRRNIPLISIRQE